MQERMKFHLHCWGLVLILTFSVEAQVKSSKKSTFKYGGVVTCKPCHLIAASGAQYEKWKTGPHARAYKTLKTEKAQKWAQERNIEDPVTSSKCVKCHVTAYGVDAVRRGPALKLLEGVSCEACHGAGSEYKKLKVMRDIYAGKVKGSDFGLLKPTREVCISCHNEESPAYDGFIYEEMVAKMAHPIPVKK